MFKQKTTIIVGAGASCELGLPSGDGLKLQIAEILRPSRDNVYGFADRTMQQIMEGLGGHSYHQIGAKLQPYWAAAERIRRGLPLAFSIDNFLFSHQNDVCLVELGKLAIGLCILRAERSSYLFEDVTETERVREGWRDERKPTSEHPELSKTWYPALAQLLFSGVEPSDISAAFRDVRFVIFNYDRCLEEFLWLALQRYFDIDGTDSAKVLQQVQFLHPYGSLGMLPWQVNSEEPLELGQLFVQDYWKIGQRLRTFTESVQSDIGASVKHSVQSAETILVLGFGYLDQNLQLLAPGAEKRARRLLSTAYETSPSGQDVMKRELLRLGAPQAVTHFCHAKCHYLFTSYRLMLSLS